MSTEIIDYPITTRHSRGGERVIPFSPGSTSADLLDPLALSRNFRRSDIARTVAAGLFSVSSLISACSSPQPPPGIGGGLPLNPTEIEQLKTPLVPTATATAEAKKPTATPEKKLTQEEAVAQVNQIISLIQNPDPVLVKKYNLDPERLAEDQAQLICGGKGCSKEHFDPENSLYGLLDLLQKGDLVGAKRMLNPQVLNGLRGSLVSKDGSSTDKIPWSMSEADQYDPQRKYFFKDSVIFSVGAVHKPAFIEGLKLYYSL